MWGEELEELNESKINPVVRNDMYGRLDIYASFDDITEENLIPELNSALVYHTKNLLQEDFLYWYRRGIQPILDRKKTTREDILNKVQENNAASIVDFKNGYFLTQPSSYTARRRGVQSKLKKLNEYLYRSGKHEADNATADWFHTVGKGVIYVEPNDDPNVPFLAHALDPRSAFVVYSLKPGNEPIFAVNFVVADEKARFDVFTKDMVYHLSGTAVGKMISPEKSHQYTASASVLDYSEPNVLGRIPIIEYRYNSINMGAFEACIPLLDEINNIVSNACDGIEQFIQTLAIAVNCEFPKDTTVTDIRRAGMIALRSVGENKADFKVLTEQLDQSQTKVLLDRLYDQVLRIAAMPTRSGGQSTQSTTGSAVLANFGWYQASCSARNTEDLFKAANRQFDAIIVDILKRKQLLDIDISDFELNFVREETENIQSKAQAFQTLLSAGLAPELAAAKSGISSDPVKDMKLSEKYLKMIWGDPDEVDEQEQKGDGKGEAEIIEQDRFNGENETGGSV